MDVHIGGILQYRANVYPTVEAAVDQEKRYTYQQLNWQANQVAHWLLQQGVEPGDRVALLCHNSVDMLSIIYGAAKVGAIVSPLNVRLDVEELTYILQDHAAKILFYDEAFVKEAKELAKIPSLQQLVQIGKTEEPDPSLASLLNGQPTHNPTLVGGGDDPVYLIYTSGTTGRPKGVVLTHRNLWMGAVAITNHYDWRMMDRNIVITPLFHISATAASLCNALKGSTTLFAEFHPRRTWELIEREKVTHFMGAPAMLKLMLEEPGWHEYDIDSLRFVICGADTVPPKLIQTFNSFGIEFCQIYGSTEFTGLATSWTIGMDREKIYTAGKPALMTELKIVDPKTGEELPNGQIGEIVLRGPQMFRGYWNQPEETKRVIRDGWYYSEDMGKLDEDGYLIIVDRYKDVIISSGENIYPAEIEGILLNMIELKEVAVVGAPDKKRGQIPMAFVVKHPGSTVTKEDILQFCQGRLANFSCGHRIEFVDALPRNASGKILKNELRKWAKAIIENEQAEQQVGADESSGK